MSIHIYTQAYTYIMPIRQIKKIGDDYGKLASLMGRDVSFSGQVNMVSRTGVESKALCICFNLLVLITISENLYSLICLRVGKKHEGPGMRFILFCQLSPKEGHWPKDFFPAQR